jgi:hypothetical protein
MSLRPGDSKAGRKTIKKGIDLDEGMLVGRAHQNVALCDETSLGVAVALITWVHG